MLQSKLHVLLVEDHQDSANCLAKLLRGAGDEVAIAHNGHTALEMVQRRNFHVALCDIGLPDMDGCNLFVQLLSVQPLKGIALTGYGADADMARILVAGFSGYLQKPYVFADVLSQIRHAVSPIPAQGCGEM